MARALLDVRPVQSCIVTVAVVVALTRMASAEPEGAIAEEGLVTAGAWVDDSTITGVLEGGVRLPSVPVMLHANAGYGHVFGTRGKLWRMGIGGESRACDETGECVIFGVELGRTAARWPDTIWEGDDYTETALFAGGRVGLDVGMSDVRVRVILEVDRYTAESSDPEELPTSGINASIALAVGYRL